jgi:D-arabinose 1-dehydrogenase-like Zn-dependent alcohol dehydrogenase
MVLIHGATHEEICLSPRGTMMNKLLTVKALRAFRMDKALKMVAELDLEPLISEFSLQDINEAVKHIRAGKGVKAVIRP